MLSSLRTYLVLLSLGQMNIALYAVLAAVVSGTVYSGEYVVMSYRSVERVAVYGGEPSLLEEGID